MFFILTTIALVNLLAIINLYLQIGKLLNEVRGDGCTIWNQYKFIAFYEGKVITEYHGIDNPVSWDEWRPLPKKTELTLAEVEERLGLDAGSLIIK